LKDAVTAGALRKLGGR